MDNQRNLLLAVALSFLLILGWDAAMRYVYPEASLMGSPDTEEQAAADGTAPVAVMSVVYSGLSKLTRTWLCAARL